MNESNGHLLMLLHLLEGRLSPAEGVQVRERLAEDEVLRRRWQMLSKAVGTALPVDDLDRLDAFDLETVAAFVEGRLSGGEAEDFEDSCWQESAALREVAAAFRSVHDDAAGDIPPQVARRLSAAVEREIGAAEQSRAIESAVSHATMPLGVPADDGSPRPNGNGRPIARSRRLPVRVRAQRSSGNRFSRESRRWYAVAASVTVCLLLGLAVFFANRREVAVVERPIVNRPVEEEQPTVKTNEREDAPDASSHATSDSPAPPNDVESPRESHSYAVVAPVPTPRERPAPTPADGTGWQPEQVVWSKVSGVVARRRQQTERWSGLLAKRPDDEAGEPIVVRTLPLGWARGGIDEGPRLVVDSDSEVRCAALRGTKATAGAVRIDLELSRGRVAISELRKGDRVDFKDGGRVWSIEPLDEETSVGFVRTGGVEWNLLAWSGAAQIGETRLDRGEMVAWNGRLLGGPSAVSKKHTWRLRPGRTLALSASLAERMNRSDDLLAALSGVDRSPRAGDVSVAAGLGFSLDPVVTVPAAAGSKLEARRLAAIGWLLTAADGEPATQQVWRQIHAATRTAQSQFSLRTWFQSAQSKSRPNRQQLGQLSAGLGAQQPVFVRQCAIYFLRQISGLPLAEYQPDQPTKKTIDSVRQKLRRAANNNRQRNRKP